MVCITIDEGESVDEAKAQYLAEHPDDPEPSHFLIVEIRDPTKRAAVPLPFTSVLGG